MLLSVELASVPAKLVLLRRSFAKICNLQINKWQAASDSWLTLYTSSCEQIAHALGGSALHSILLLVNCFIANHKR